MTSKSSKRMYPTYIKARNSKPYRVIHTVAVMSGSRGEQGIRVPFPGKSQKYMFLSTNGLDLLKQASIQC